MNCFDEVIKNIDYYNKFNNIDLWIKYLFLEENCSIDEIDKFYDNMLNLGIKNIYIGLNHYIDNIPDNILQAMKYFITKGKGMGFNLSNTITKPYPEIDELVPKSKNYLS